MNIFAAGDTLDPGQTTPQASLLATPPNRKLRQQLNKIINRFSAAFQRRIERIVHDAGNKLGRTCISQSPCEEMPVRMGTRSKRRNPAMPAVPHYARPDLFNGRAIALDILGKPVACKSNAPVTPRERLRSTETRTISSTCASARPRSRRLKLMYIHRSNMGVFCQFGRRCKGEARLVGTKKRASPLRPPGFGGARMASKCFV